MVTAQKNSKTTLFAALVVVMIWGSAFVSIREALHSFSAGSLSLFRYLVASIIMAFVYFRIPNRATPTPIEILKIIAQGALGIALYTLANNQSEVTVAAATSSFVISQVPMGIALISMLVFREKPNRRRSIGIVISTIGVFIIAASNNALPFHQQANPGVLWSLLALISSSAFWVLQKPLLEKFHPIELISLCIWAGTALLSFYLPQLLNELPKATQLDILNAIYLGVGPSALAYGLWTFIVARLCPTTSSGFLYLMPLATLLFGWIFMNEHISVLEFCGGLLALFGAYVMQSTPALDKTPS